MVVSSPPKPIKEKINSDSDEIEYGSVTGMLETVNLHRNINYFYLYPTHNNTKIKCKFPKILRDKVIEALGRYIEVYGKLRYKPNADEFAEPYAVDVDEIEIFPPAETLPTLSSLRGIAEGALGSQSIEEYIWEIRNEGE